MRISDWSSDVCSSDLDGVVAHVAHVQRAGRVRQHRQAVVRRLRGFLPHLERAGVVPEALGGGFDGSGVVGGGVGGHGGRTSGAARKPTAVHKLPPYGRNMMLFTSGGAAWPDPSTGHHWPGTNEESRGGKG